MDPNIEQTMEQLKKVRSIAKGIVTRKANKVNEILASCDKADSVQEITKELDEVIEQFEATHEAYHSLFKEEHDVKESNLYFDSVSELVSEHQLKIKSCLEQPASQNGQERQNQIQPEDSLSTAVPVKSSRFRQSQLLHPFRVPLAKKQELPQNKLHLKQKQIRSTNCMNSNWKN